jgi:hypothetical protein
LALFADDIEVVWTEQECRGLAVLAESIRLCTGHRNSPKKKKFIIPEEDDYYPGLVGNHTGDVVTVTPTGDGLAIRTTYSVVQLR